MPIVVFMLLLTTDWVMKSSKPMGEIALSRYFRHIWMTWTLLMTWPFTCTLSIRYRKRPKLAVADTFSTLMP